MAPVTKLAASDAARNSAGPTRSSAVPQRLAAARSAIFAAATGSDHSGLVAGLVIAGAIAFHANAVPAPLMGKGAGQADDAGFDAV